MRTQMTVTERSRNLDPVDSAILKAEFGCYGLVTGQEMTRLVSLLKAYRAGLSRDLERCSEDSLKKIQAKMQFIDHMLDLPARVEKAHETKNNADQE